MEPTCANALSPSPCKTKKMPRPNVQHQDGGNDLSSLLHTLIMMTSRGVQAGESKHQWLALAQPLPILIRLVLPTLQSRRRAEVRHVLLLR